jgi:hypothetical protein
MFTTHWLFLYKMSDYNFLKRILLHGVVSDEHFTSACILHFTY